MGRPPKNWSNEPQRTESPVRMTVAEQAPVAQEPVMKTAEEPMIGADWRTLVAIAQIPPLEAVQTDPVLVVMLPDGAIPPPESTIPPMNPMDDVPRDGTMVNLITADGSEVRVVWRNTTRYNSRAQKWERTGFWTSPMNRVPVEVEAVGWTLGSGFLTPEMVVA